MVGWLVLILMPLLRKGEKKHGRKKERGKKYKSMEWKNKYVTLSEKLTRICHTYYEVVL